MAANVVASLKSVPYIVAMIARGHHGSETEDDLQEVRDLIGEPGQWLANSFALILVGLGREMGLEGPLENILVEMLDRGVEAAITVVSDRVVAEYLAGGGSTGGL
jgi:hypothetical protein